MSSEGATKTVQQTAVLQISWDRSIDDSRLSFQTYMPADAPQAALNQTLDNLHKAMERQATKSRLKQLRKDREAGLKAISRAMEDMERLDRQSEQRASVSAKRNPLEAGKAKIDRETASTTLQRWREDIRKLDDLIAEAEALMKDMNEAQD